MIFRPNSLTAPTPRQHALIGGLHGQDAKGLLSRPVRDAFLVKLCPKAGR
jgi:hypothetical protein